MSNGELKRIDDQQLAPQLPVGIEQLPKETQLEIINSVIEKDAEIRAEIQRKVGLSRVAEHDLAVAVDTINRLQDERKIFTYKQKAETGSGNAEVVVRGGDTKFIMPIVIGVGVILIIILLIVAGGE